MTSTAPIATRNVALTTARAWAGIVGALQLAGISYFLVFAPEEAVYVSPWIDIPAVLGLLAAVGLLLATAFAPLSAGRRVRVGFAAVVVDVVVTLVKIPVYDEPESATVIGLAAVLALLLVLARRADR